MRQLKLLLVLLLGLVNLTFAQYSFRSAGSNSGIIVGTIDATNFAGINYDLTSSKLGFSYKQTTQEKVQGTTPKTRYPNFWGYNTYLGFAINSGKSTLVKNNVWQGGLEGAVDLFRTWDKTAINQVDVKSDTSYKYFNKPDSTNNCVLQYETRCECEAIWKNKCDSIRIISSSGTSLLKQVTLFGRISTTAGRQNLAIPQSSTLTITDEFFTTPRVAFGINLRRQYSCLQRVTFTGAASVSYYFLPHSTGRLTEYTIQSVGTLYNSGTTVQLTDSKSYFLGSSEYEGVFNPRIDLVTSINLGEKKPYLNIIGAYSPTRSTITEIGWKQNYALGLGFSLPVLPDQMLFAILYEGLATNTNKRVKALTFYATIPFSFK